MISFETEVDSSTFNRFVEYVEVSGADFNAAIEAALRLYLLRHSVTSQKDKDYGTLQVAA